MSQLYWSLLTFFPFFVILFFFFLLWHYPRFSFCQTISFSGFLSAQCWLSWGPFPVSSLLLDVPVHSHDFSCPPSSPPRMLFPVPHICTCACLHHRFSGCVTSAHSGHATCSKASHDSVTLGFSPQWQWAAVLLSWWLHRLERWIFFLSLNNCYSLHQSVL